MEWYFKVLTNYVGFQGRARRKEYWMFVLFNLIFSIIFAVIEVILGLAQYLTYIYALAILLPSLAVAVRRLHDTGRSGWWLLISFVPIIGGIVLLVFECTDSDPNTNKYGTNPKLESSPNEPI